MLWLVLVFLLNGDARSHNISRLDAFFNQPPYAKRVKNHLNLATFAFAVCGIRTTAACVASECVIHYTIASRHCHRVKLTLELELNRISSTSRGSTESQHTHWINILQKPEAVHQAKGHEPGTLCTAGTCPRPSTRSPPRATSRFGCFACNDNDMTIVALNSGSYLQRKGLVLGFYRILDQITLLQDILSLPQPHFEFSQKIGAAVGRPENDSKPSWYQICYLPCGFLCPNELQDQALMVYFRYCSVTKEVA